MNVNRASFSTKARTWLLLAGLTALFIGVGAAIGGAALWFFVVFSVLLNFAAYWMSDKFAIRASRAQEVSESEAPDLHHMVGELAQLYDVPKPRVYLIPSDQPNAFATGRNPEHAAVAVTQGLLQYMPRDQVRGVLAHEFSHIKNRDILVSSIAAMIAGAISAVGNIFFFASMFGGDDRDNPLGAIGALATIIIAPLAATLLQLAVSRQREYLADATAARVLGTGDSLAAALETLERGRNALPMQVNPATAALYIVHPFRGVGVANLFSTHPPIEERIARLREYDRSRGLI
ncbi:MAG TPA: zinc metalloprotease HtpX [Gaiellaceae bacterium]|nr:zinc metalloprotease HtpX [Gaiellaceae bacterium]